MNHQKTLLAEGRWLLYRHNPELLEQGKNPLVFGYAYAYAIARRFDVSRKSLPDAYQEQTRRCQALVRTSAS